METWRTHLDPEQILEHGPWLRALARALVRDPASADDLAQEAWLVAGRRGDLDAERLRPFISGVVRRLASTWRRSERRRSDREGRAPLGDASPSPPEIAVQLELQEQLLRELRELDEPYRTTLVMRFYGGQSSAEIARRTNTPDATVRARLARGLLQLRSRLERRGERDGREWRAALAPLVGAASWDAPRAAAFAWIAAACVVVGVAATWRWSAREPQEAQAEVALELSGGPRGAVDVAAAQLEFVDVARVDVASAPTNAAGAAATPAGALRVEARAVDESGSPLAGVALEFLFVKVEPAPLSAADGVLVAEVDAKTAGNLARLPEVVVQFSRSGWRTERVARKLAPGAVLQLGDVVLHGCGRIEGLVVDHLGLPVRGARVLATLAPTPERFDPAVGPGREVHWTAASATSQDDGRFEIAELLAGHWNVWASSPRHPWTHVDAVPLRGGGRASLRLALPPEDSSHVVAGTLLGSDGKPTRGTLRLVGPDGSSDWEHETFAGFDGRFELRVEDRDAHWRLVASGFEKGSGWCERDVRAGQIDLVVQLEQGPLRRVRVVDRAGRPLRGARVFAVDFERAQIAGSATLSGADGVAQVRWSRDAVSLVASAPRCETVVATPQETGETAEIVLGPGPGVTGRVEAEGRPIAGAQVELLRASDEGCFEARHESEGSLGLVQYVNATAFGRADTDETGAFALDVPSDLQGAEERDHYVLVRAQGHADARVGPLRLRATSELDDLVVSLTAGGAVRGRVRTDDPQSLAGRCVVLANGFGSIRELDLDPRGGFAADHLAPGRWQACVAPAQAVRRLSWAFGAPSPEPRWSFEVTDGQLADCTLELSARAPAPLEGELATVPHAASVWRARLTALDGSHWSHERSLDADGRFRIAARGPGRHRLEVWSEDPRWGRAWVREELDLGPGGLRWRCELNFARVSGRSASRAKHLTVLQSLPGGGRFGCDLETGETGEFSARWLPAGRSRAYVGAWTDTSEARGPGAPLELESDVATGVELP
jgi:RNA polymerase sigma factor (sigma-70 family)